MSTNFPTLSALKKKVVACQADKNLSFFALFTKREKYQHRLLIHQMVLINEIEKIFIGKLSRKTLLKYLFT